MAGGHWLEAPATEARVAAHRDVFVAGQLVHHDHLGLSKALALHAV